MTGSEWRYPYTATERQQVMHDCDAQEILFGGAAGPGKTEGLIAAGVTFSLMVPGARVFLFRRTYKMLELEIIPRMRARIPDDVAHYRPGDHVFEFTNGSTFHLGYLASDADLMNYQGVEVTLALFDELCQFTRYQYTYIRSRLRVAGATAQAMHQHPTFGVLNWVPRMISTSNPTGPGHSWCKAMFVDPSPGADIVFDGGIAEDEPLSGRRSMCYIPARATDNPYLDQDAYRRQLAGLDPVLRRALEFGDWDVLEGVRFSQFRRDVHVVDPEQLPIPMVGYPRAVGVDWGISAPFAALWGALLPDGLVVVYREIGGPNITAEDQARLILEAEEPGERAEYRPIPVALDPSCWARAANAVIKPLDPNQPAVGSIAWWYRKVMGGQVVKAWNERVAGWQLVDQGLAVRADGLPRLLIYSTCTNLIRSLPSMLRSIQNPEDIMSSPKQDDHYCDALRYLLGQLVRGGVQRVTPEIRSRGERETEEQEEATQMDSLLGGEHRRRWLDSVSGGGRRNGGSTDS